MKLSKFSWMVPVILIFPNCSKGGSNPPLMVPDTTKPTISITKPSTGQAFTAGNTILLQATFSDNENSRVMVSFAI